MLYRQGRKFGGPKRTIHCEDPVELRLVDLLRHLVTTWIDWLFRRRSLTLRLINIGVVCLSLALGGGLVLDVSLPFRNGRFDIAVNSGGGPPVAIVYGTAGIGLMLILSGLVLMAGDQVAKQRERSRKRIVVIEARGLRDSRGSPLIQAVPPQLKGLREDLTVDLRQGLKDGVIAEPAAALEHLISLPADLRRRENSRDRQDLTVVYGGLAPVPFTFLIGVLIDDETSIVILDWDRHQEAWRELGGADDGKRFQAHGMNGVRENGKAEMALAVSVSYEIRMTDIAARIGEMPLVQLKLEEGSVDCHWSEKKQRALGKQFFDTVLQLKNRGIKRVHLFLAAQNSVVFRFGRLYDKRNFPEVVVYQYQSGSITPYPWGVLMPVSSLEQPEIVV